MSIVVINLQNLVGLGSCDWTWKGDNATCPKVSSVCPVGSKPTADEKNCTVFNPCANLNAAKLNPLCSQKNCPIIAKPVGVGCTPTMDKQCITAWTCGLQLL